MGDWYGDGDPEVNQTLSFNVSNDNNGLFSVQPVISAGGNLSFTPAAGSMDQRLLRYR